MRYHPRPLSWLLPQRAADRGLLRRDGLAAAALLNFPLVDYLDLLGESHLPLTGCLPDRLQFGKDACLEGEDA